MPRRFVVNMTSPVATMIVPAAPHRKYRDPHRSAAVEPEVNAREGVGELLNRVDPVPGGLMTRPVTPSKVMLSVVKVIAASRAPLNRTIALSRLGLLTAKPERVPICACACAKRPATDTLGAGLPIRTSAPEDPAPHG